MVVSRAHYDYIAAHTTPEPAIIPELKQAALEAGLPPIWIGPEQAAFMRVLLGLIGARRVLEVGTLAGTTAIQMALALPPDGLVDTVELLPHHAEVARAGIERAGESARVTVHVGAGQDVLPTLPSGAYDAIFLDADKSGHADYLAESVRLLRPNGMLLVDNAFAFGQLLEEVPTDGEVEAVRRFNDQLAADERFEATMVGIGDGLWVGRLHM